MRCRVRGGDQTINGSSDLCAQKKTFVAVEFAADWNVSNSVVFESLILRKKEI